MPSVPEIVLQYSSRLVLFESPVVETLNTWRQSGKRSEAGGILVGYRRGDHLHIVDCTTPYLQDRRSRFRFFRRDARHRQVARRYWDRTQHQAYYLGEWHTHPEDYPTPSQIDHAGWDTLMRSSLGPDILFLIVGRIGLYGQLGKQLLKPSTHDTLELHSQDKCAVTRG